MKKTLLFLFLFLPGVVRANTITAANVSQSAVASAIASAVDGDTVVIPAGSAHWTGGSSTSTITITKGITLQGSTTTDTSTQFGTANDQTIIIDDGTSVIQTIVVTLNSTSQFFRMTGITFQLGTNNAGINQSAVFIGGTARGGPSGNGSFRVDHCHFVMLARNVSVQVDGWLYGVIDHNVMYGPSLPVHVRHGSWSATSTPNAAGYGDGSWNDLPYYGSEKFAFMEDNCFDNRKVDPANPSGLVGIPATNGASGIDAKYGGRLVLRHNFLNDFLIGSHGTEGGRPRGTRTQEVYSNIFTYNPANIPNFPSATNFRSGSGLVYSNQYKGSLHGVGNMQAYRVFQDFGPPFDNVADGTNAWDLNSGGSLTAALDQPGRGKGDLMDGVASPTPAWPNDAIEPVYVWGNSVDNPNDAASAQIGNNGQLNIQQNRDVYNASAQIISGRAVQDNSGNSTPLAGYIAFTYPHPLITGGVSAPPPPINLRISGKKATLNRRK